MVSADLSLIGVAVLINFANIHLKVLRWRALLAARGIHYPLGRAWGAFLSSPDVTGNRIVFDCQWPRPKKTFL